MPRSAFIGPRLKNGRTRTNRKRTGTKLPKAVSILNKGVDTTLQKSTMYAPTANLMLNTFSNKLKANIGPFGTRWAGVLRYVDVFKVSTGALGIYTETQFNLNSLFDPDRTGVGHQPLGYDQLTAIYTRYRVIKTNYRITPMHEGLAVTPVAFITFVNNVTTSGASVSAGLEQGYSTFSFSNVYTQPKPIKGSITLNQLTGNSLEAYRSDDVYAGTISSSPSELLILHIGLESNGGVASSTDFYIEMEFDVEMWDPVQVVPS